jgi:iron complex outermembrane recepter protein
MLKLIQKSLIAALLLICVYPSTAQLMARVQTSKVSRNSEKTLKEALGELKNYYGKDILFFDRNIEAFTVSNEAINLKTDLEQNLNSVLKSTDLVFKKNKNGGYVITKNTERRLVNQEPRFPETIEREAINSSAEEVKLTPKITEQPVKGKVVDEKGEPLLGVNIILKGTKKGTTTDASGNFKIDAPKNSVLIFSFVGYITKEIQVSDDETLTVKMESNTGELTEIIVVGSRSNVARTKTETPAPVDVISVKDLAQTGQGDLTQMINFSAPSFNSARQTISNGTDHIDPATLRGLGPDQVLVLINGKRQHSTALVNVNSTVGRGSVGTDLNAIPMGAIERIEVLRDGAAAQYGSDAIAGVINVILKKNTGNLSFTNQFGQTKVGDGKAYLGNLNYGIGLGNKGGFLNATINFSDRSPTNRTGSYNNTVYLASLPATRFQGTSVYVPLTAAQLSNQTQDNNLVAQKNFDRNGMIVGNSKSTNYAGFLNMALPVSANLELYGFGGFNQRYGRAAGFYRYPNNSRTNNLTLYPDGYLPFIETDIKDYSAAFGIRKVVKEGWNIDLSNVYGGNSIDFSVKNSLNASMGNNSPKDFYCGQLSFSQNTTNLNFSKGFQNLGFTKFFNIAFGGEFRVDYYAIKQGEEASWKDYNPANTPAAQVKAAGVQVFGGFRPTNEVNKSRSNLGLYLDLESDLTEKLLLGAAVRFENYSDFGSNLSNKLVTRYKFTDAFSIRGGINRGFRAPSLHQKFYSAVSTQFITVAGVNQQREVTTVRNDADITARLGIPELKPETSLSYSLGLTSNLNNKLLITIDAYQIDIQDRIVVSGRFSSTIPQLADFFKGTDVTEAQFFTNAIDTRTKGIDAIITYKNRFENNTNLTLNLAANFNETIIQGGSTGVRTPTQLNGLGETLMNREEKGRIEVNQPKSKIVLSANYQIKNLNLKLQGTRFGEISTIAPSDPLQDQTFSAKWISDIALGYKFNKNITVNVGANNVFDVYPDLVADPRLTNDGTVIYSRFATQFGFNGAYYFVNLNLNF